MAEVDFVSKWQQSLLHADGEPFPAEPKLVANLYESLSSFYSHILNDLSKAPSIESPVLLSLQRTHSYLVLWADGFDFGEGMMDASLAKSKRVRVTTLRLLLSVSRTLTDRLLPHVDCDKRSLLASRASDLSHLAAQVKDFNCQDHNPGLDSDTDSDTSSDDGDIRLSEIAEDLRIDTQCLLDLGSRIQEPAIGPVAAETAAELDGLRSWDPAQSFINRIRQRYPECETTLAERLGNANWSRALRCQELKKENSRLQQQIAANSSNETSSKAASTLFHDSGLGSSIPSDPSLPALSEYADTVASYDGGQGGSVRVPPLPEGAREGMPFECVGCGTMVTARGKRTWKKHLFQDLQPYMCLEDVCPHNKTPFATREQWANHLSLDHADTSVLESIDCRICSQKLSGNMVKTTSHLARHLEEIALTVLPTSLEPEEGMDDASRHDSTDSSQCDELGETSTKAVQETQAPRAGSIRRRGSDLTTSTDFSTDSDRDAWHIMQQELNDNEELSLSDQKDIFRALKRTTELKDAAGATPLSGQPTEPRDSKRQRKLKRLFAFTQVSVEQILQLLEEDILSPETGRGISNPKAAERWRSLLSSYQKGMTLQANRDTSPTHRPESTHDRDHNERLLSDETLQFTAPPSSEIPGESERDLSDLARTIRIPQESGGLTTSLYQDFSAEDGDSTSRDHLLYKDAEPEDDGLFHNYNGQSLSSGNYSPAEGGSVSH